jgi:hypothetical protein
MKQIHMRNLALVFSCAMLIGCGGGGNGRNNNAPSNNNGNQTNNNTPANPNNGDQTQTDTSNLAAGFQEFREILAGTEGFTQQALAEFNSNEANTLRRTFQDTQLFFEKVENQTDPSGFSGSFQNTERWTFCADGRFEVVFRSVTTVAGANPDVTTEQAQGVWDATFTGEPTKRNVIFGHSNAPEIVAVNPTGFIPFLVDSVSESTVRSGEKLYRRTSISCN